MVTHDRYFLSRITDHIMEVDHGKIYHYTGNYETYLEQRALRYQQAQAHEAKRQNYLRKELEWIRAGAQARSTKQKSRIERFEKISAIKAPEQLASLKLENTSSRLGKKIIEINNISKAYGNKVLFSSFSHHFIFLPLASVSFSNMFKAFILLSY